MTGFRYKQAQSVSEDVFAKYSQRLADADRHIKTGDGRGSDFLGWRDIGVRPGGEEHEKILAAAKRIREQSDILLVIGIGGSYLGARAVIEYLKTPYHNQKSGTQVYFIGNSFSGGEYETVMSLCEGKRVSVNVISKSGTTTESAVAFRFVREYMESRYGREEAARRIYATTDARRGALKSLADAEGYECFVVPDDVGGRFSVLTAVGLLPAEVAGVDTTALLEGALAEREALFAAGLENPAYKYAVIRNAMLDSGRKCELLVSYDPDFRFMGEWFKQLFGESEGKEHKGLFPCAAIFSTDLHSLGQFVQDGSRTLFETVVRFKTAKHGFAVANDSENADGLNFLSGMDMAEINEKARLGTLIAHTEGGVPNIIITSEAKKPYEVGKLIYFFEIAVAISGYMLGVNPFDQPGVESYKKNMFALLGKPGYEDMKAALEAKL